MNSHLNLPIYSLICMSNTEDENIINNNYHAPHTHQKMTMNAPENDDEQHIT